MTTRIPVLASTWLLMLPLACSKKATPESPAAPSAEPQVGPATQAFYGRSFPEATRFNIKRIPPELIRQEDRSNSTYVEAYDSQDRLLGYLRDFEGPVTFEKGCECNPLSLTISLNPDHSFHSIISLSPLQKYGHEAMTDEEFQRLLQIAAKPDPRLLESPTISSVVDATTGATKTDYTGLVVPKAALSSRRIAALVVETQRAILGAPLSDAQTELDKITAAHGSDPAALATALAEFLGRNTNVQVGVQVFQSMVEAYVYVLGETKAPLPAVDDRILDPGIGGEAEGVLISAGCEQVIRVDANLPIAKRCVKALRKRIADGAPVDSGMANSALGLAAAASGDASGAAAKLKAAIDGKYRQVAEYDPDLIASFIQASAGKGGKDACEALEALAFHHARYPALPALASRISCGTGTLDKARVERKRALLARLKPAAQRTTCPPLPLKSPTPRLELGSKPTVLMVFATWCPHCQQEMPGIVEFANKAKRVFGDKVDVRGVRTLSQRDREPYQDFAKRFDVTFEVAADTDGSDALRLLSAAANTSGGIPLLVVLDKAGKIAYLMPNGMHRDLAEDLSWAVESLL